MCGISTVVTLGAHASKANVANTNGTHDKAHKYHKIIENNIDASLQRIAHRGPDSRGIWMSESGRVGLGHCRLSIVDLSAGGDQPFHTPDDTVHCVVNGEIYGHEEIRAGLIREFDYKFKGNSDCEVVIALYQHYGLSFLNLLRGEFALCLYDETKELFIAARDRFGIKPLFWTVVDGKLLVASEMKAFLPFGWRPEWDVRSLVDAGWVIDTRTQFKGVEKIRPGHYLVCTSFETMESRQYWDMEYPDKRHIETRSEEEMINGVRERLLEAVRLRLRADVPVGIYLSGGIDSSVIAGMITHLMKEQGITAGSQSLDDKVCAFTIAFDENSGYDESAIAARTADSLGIKMVKKHMNEEELAKYFENATYHCEHSNFDLNFVGKFALSEVTRDSGFKVVLTGEGSDEHFAGYVPFLAEFLREPDLAWPQTALASMDSLREGMLGKYDAALQASYGDIGIMNANEASDSSRWQVNNLGFFSGFRIFRPPRVMFLEWVQPLYCNFDPRHAGINNIDERTKQLFRNKWHPLHSSLYMWNKSLLVNNLLSCLGDRVEMAHSVEARTPFLDHHLTEYVNTLPPSLKVRCNIGNSGANGSHAGANGESASTAVVLTEKWVLREASKPFVTDEIYRRPKHPYTAPLMYPVDGPLHKLMKKLLTMENVNRLGFLSWDAVKSNMEQAFSGNGDDKGLSHAIRATVMTAQWVILGEKFGVATAYPLSRI